MVHPAVLMYLSQSLVAGHCVTLWGHWDSVRVCGSSWWAGAYSQTESRPPWPGINQICRSSAWCLHARHRGGAHHGTKMVPCYFFDSLRAAFVTFWWFSRRNLNPHQTNVLDSLCLSVWRNAWLAQIGTGSNLTLLLEWCLFLYIYTYIYLWQSDNSFDVHFWCSGYRCSSVQTERIRLRFGFLCEALWQCFLFLHRAAPFWNLAWRALFAETTPSSNRKASRRLAVLMHIFVALDQVISRKTCVCCFTLVWS